MTPSPYARRPLAGRMESSRFGTTSSGLPTKFGLQYRVEDMTTRGKAQSKRNSLKFQRSAASGSRQALIKIGSDADRGFALRRWRIQYASTLKGQTDSGQSLFLLHETFSR